MLLSFSKGTPNLLDEGPVFYMIRPGKVEQRPVFVEYAYFTRWY